MKTMTDNGQNSIRSVAQVSLDQKKEFDTPVELFVRFNNWKCYEEY